MKILQINSLYNYGSTGKITKDIHEELIRQGVDSVVVYGRGKTVKDEKIHRICSDIYGKVNNFASRFTGLPYGGCFISTKRCIQIIEREEPDIVHLQCLNAFFCNIYRLVDYLKKKNITTVLTLHAEFMYTANCGYAFECNKWKTGCGKCKNLKNSTGSYYLDRTAHSQRLMRKVFSGFGNLSVVGVSEWVMGRAIESGMFKDAGGIECIHNGVNLDCFDCKPRLEDDEVAAKYGLSRNKKIVMHITPSLQNPYKGGEFFLQLAHEMDDGYQCVVVGANTLADEQGIRFIPFVEKKTELASLYRIADVIAVTSTADNFPTVCLESQVCGTPIVGFDVGGVKETIWHGMGECVAKGDMTALRTKVMQWAAVKKTIPQDIICECSAFFDKKRMVSDYIQMYARLKR